MHCIQSAINSVCLFSAFQTFVPITCLIGLNYELQPLGHNMNSAALIVGLPCSAQRAQQGMWQVSTGRLWAHAPRNGCLSPIRTCPRPRLQV